MRVWALRRTAIVAACIATTSVGQARDESTKACLANYESGQRQRKAGDLVGARDALFRCAVATCPEIVRSDCVEWSAELDRQVPTVVVSARWDDGSDVARARVSVDGRVVAERLDGTPLALNPGERTIAVDVDGQSAKQRLIVNQGEKARLVRFELERAREAPASGASPDRVAPTPAAGPGVLPFVLAGTSLLAAAGFGYFAIKGTRDLQELRDDCAPHCTRDQLDGVKRDLLIADVLLGVSVLAGGAAAVLFVVGTPDPERQGVVVHATATF
jgi:hypothetical protein